MLTLPRKDSAGTNMLKRIFGRDADKPPRVTFGRVAGKQKRPEPEKKSTSTVHEFDDNTDFILTAILIAVMKVNPGIRPEMAIQKSLEWARRIGTPNSAHLWRSQAIRINRVGVPAEVSKLRRELRKLL